MLVLNTPRFVLTGIPRAMKTQAQVKLSDKILYIGYALPVHFYFSVHTIIMVGFITKEPAAGTFVQ
jgi:hypothetical protein